MSTAFAQHLKQYPQELPHLQPGTYVETDATALHLNCHCFAVGLHHGNYSPADQLAYGHCAKTVQTKTDDWFSQYNFKPKEGLPLCCTQNKIKIVLLGLSAIQAEQLSEYHSRKQIILSKAVQHCLDHIKQFKDNHVYYPTHSLYQNRDGWWYSKMGVQGPIIKIAHANLMTGAAYGKIIRVYEQP